MPGNIPPLPSPFKNATSSEHKNPYIGSRGTPIKRKLIQNQIVKTLIGLIDMQLEPELPGGAGGLALESPAKRRRKAEG